MSLVRDITQGNSSPVISVAPKTSSAPIVMDSNWTCSTGVVDCNFATIIASRDVPIKNGANTEFLAGLTPSETNQLAAASPYTTYYWLIELVNLTLTPVYRVEKKIKLNVMPQGI